MKRITRIAAVGLVAGLSVTMSLPAHAAPSPSVSVNIVAISGSTNCKITLTARGFPASEGYEAWFSGGGVMFETDARGSAKLTTEGTNEAFNKDVATSITWVQAVNDPGPTDIRTRVSNRCPAA